MNDAEGQEVAGTDSCIEDLNYASSSEELGIHALKPPRAHRRGVLVNVGSFILKWLRAAAHGFLAPSWRSLQGTRVLTAVWSQNQLQAVARVVEGLDDARVLSLHRNVPGPRFPEFLAYAASMPFLPELLRLRANATGYRRLGFDYQLDRYWLTFGYYRTALRVLRRLHPRLVVVANDHTMEPRTIQHAASHLGIPTAYIQHASVTREFPPLSFDLAFLDGRDAAVKYDRPTSGRPRVFLTGIPKADAARSRARTRTSLHRIGVCVNALDPIPAVKTFVDELRTLAPTLEIVVRPHPSDLRPWASVIPTAKHSDARSEPSFDFLDVVDAVVTGPSNIALEASLVGVRPVFVDFGGLGRDHYGFVASGLCRRVEGARQALDVLVAEMASTPDIGPLRKYCATVGTNYDGRSAELVRELITEELGEGIDMSRWERAEGFTHVDVYQLRG